MAPYKCHLTGLLNNLWYILSMDCRAVDDVYLSYNSYPQYIIEQK